MAENSNHTIDPVDSTTANKKEAAKQSTHSISFFQIRNGKGFEDDVDLLMRDVLNDARGNRDTSILHRLILRFLGPEGTYEQPIRSKEYIVATLEKYHVDATYRDLYYTQYARRHLTVPRFTYRLSFFDDFSPYGGSFNERYSLITWLETPTKSIQEAYLGSVVINPVAQTLICKATVDPNVSMYWDTDALDSHETNTVATDEAFVRLSTYKVNIAGKKLWIQAFPYHGQDGEALSCAEVTLLNLTRYYANEYNGYPLIEPSDILDAERHRAFSRVIPSTGLSYQTLCSILCDFGFRPELYDRSRLGQDNPSNRTGESSAQQIIHTYLESGIPIAVNVEPPTDPNNGHSLVVIGHGKPRAELENHARENAVLISEKKDEGEDASDTKDLGFTIRLLNTSDFFDTYVVMDDNQDPYSIRKFEELSIHPQMNIARFIAPIQRGMTVDAMDALMYFEQILRDPADGIASWAEGWFKKLRKSGRLPNSSSSDIDVAIRVYLASTRRFKPNRTENLSNAYRAAAYADIPLPRFVWVCEIFLLDELKAFYKSNDANGNQCSTARPVDAPYAFAEIVLDATVSRTTAARDAVLIEHFPDLIAYRMPDSTSKELSTLTEDEMQDIFDHDVDYGLGFIPAYSENLMLVTSQHQHVAVESE